MQQKQYAQAVEAYKKSLKKNPSSEKTRYNLSEAIRKLREQQKDKNKNDQDQPKNSSNEQKKKPAKKNRNPKNKKNDGNGANLPNTSVDRLLDQLTRAEAATKKKLNKGKETNVVMRSGKDW